MILVCSLCAFVVFDIWMIGCICRDIIDIVGPAVEPQEYIARCHRYRYCCFVEDL